MQSLKDEEVMLSYQKGEMQAMDELLHRYKNPVYHFAFRLMRNLQEAEDVAQEVFLKVHEHRLDYTQSGKFSTWIFSIAHNLCVSRLRKKRWTAFWPMKKNEPDEPVEFPSADPSPGDCAASDDEAQLLRKCIQGLPFLQKEALILREYEDLDYQDIARILHRSLGTVKTLIHRARLSLKEKLLPYAEEIKGGSNG